MKRGIREGGVAVGMALAETAAAKHARRRVSFMVEILDDGCKTV